MQNGMTAKYARNGFASFFYLLCHACSFVPDEESVIETDCLGRGYTSPVPNEKVQ